MLPLLFVPASRQKTSSGTEKPIPFRYNRRSCHHLPVSIKWDIHISTITLKPGQQCLSEAIFHLRLHIPLSLGTPASNEPSHFTLLHIHRRHYFTPCVKKVLRGFPCSTVYTCTLFFHEFSIWENRNTFPVVCKRGIILDSVEFYILLCLYIHRHTIRNAMVVNVIPAAMLAAKRIV